MSDKGSKKGSFRSSKQDTMELNKNWFSDLEPPKIYNETKTSSKKMGENKKRVRKNVSNKKRSTQNKGYNHNIEPAQRTYRQETQFRSASPTQRFDNFTTAEIRNKQNKKRKIKNKFRKALIWILTIILLISVSVTLSLTVFFPITEISVSGNKRYTKDEVLAVCSIDLNENLFLTKTNDSVTKLESALPYIYNAKISRKLPGTIKINITETKAKYQIKNNDVYIYLDDNFKVLEINPKKLKGAIVIKKSSVKTSREGTVIEFEKESTLKYLKVINDSIISTQFEKVTAIASVSPSDNYIVYDGRITIKLGNSSNIEHKIYQALTTIDKLQSDNPNVKGTINITSDKEIYFTEE